MVPTVRTSWLGRDDTGQSHLLGPGWDRPTPTPRRKLIIEGGSSQWSEVDDEEAHDEDDYYFSMGEIAGVPGVVARNVFLELWLGIGVKHVCECAGCGQYGWVRIDCPPQLLADEFGSLGTIQTVFVYGNSTWRCGCCAKRSSFNVLVGMVPTVRTSWLGRDDTGQSHLLGPGWYRPTPTPRRKLIIEGGSSQLSEFDDEEAHDEDDYYFSMVKTLTKNDINSSKLYLETSFAVGGLDCSTKSIYLKSYRSMVSSSPRYFKDGSRPLLECLVLMISPFISICIVGLDLLQPIPTTTCIMQLSRGPAPNWLYESRVANATHPTSAAHASH
ncbi:hypothetical protein DEO72_LG8g1755 [Vigna unguiculata]|uniref:Uncharacterized protein n=1 Tax=Vigna unguiculata TaxID=3917 RepID=A0A4D6MQA3_VIGUN|nr:hypothetical protein DEO72_LG8g1755 [Vigna unguiculata]